jgi:predicted transcriptional regulator
MMNVQPGVNVQLKTTSAASETTDTAKLTNLSEARQVVYLAMDYILNNKRVDLEELSHRIERSYSTIEESQKEYFMGFYTSLLNMIRAKHLSEMDINEAKRCIEKSKYTLPILNFVKEQPGITHNDLSNALGIKINQLSNLMPVLRVDQLISEAKEGREKHYFITQKGLRVLKNHSIEQVSIDVSRIIFFDDPFQPETFHDVFGFKGWTREGIAKTR